MDVFHLILCLSVLLSGALAGSVFVKYELPAKQSNEGDKSVQFVWEQDLDFEDGYDNLEINHTNAVTSEVRNLGTMKDVTQDKVVEGYSLTAEKNGNIKSVTFTIDTVGVRDNGTFWLYSWSTDGTHNYKSEAKLMVTETVRIIKMLYLKFDEHDQISAKPTDPIEMEPGTYPVSCIAEGSNPATTDVKLYLNGNMVTLQGDPVISRMEDIMTKYKTVVVGNVKLPESKAVHEVECVARDPEENALSTRLEVSVVVAETEVVQCQETKAEEGEESVSLTCTVDHAKMNVSGFSFEVGKTGDIIKSGENKPNSTGTVSTESLSETKTKVTLTLPKAEGWHFESDFYLLIDSTNGKVMKEPVKLEKKGDDDGDGDAGNCLKPFLGLILFLVLTVSCQWFKD